MSQSNHAAAAAAIRAELRRHGIKATVRSKVYSGGSSVDVRIEEDVLPAVRREIRDFASRYQMGHFDGMTDSYDYSNRNENLPQVRHVFVNARYTDETLNAAQDYADAHGLSVWAVLEGNEGSFWTNRKPRVRLATEAA